MNPVLSAWLGLFRLPNAVIAGAGVWLGYASTFPKPDIGLAIWGSLSMLLLTAAGNADNDACDLESDRVNRPERPLPAGKLSPGSVRRAAFLLYALAILVSGLADPWHGALAAGMALLLLAYNRGLKGKPLVGNLAVSLLCALAIYFPEFPALPMRTLPACVFALLATMAREIVKDAEDVEGDNAAGLKTFPIVAGLVAARKLALAVTVLILALLPMPLVYLNYKRPYAVASALLAAPVLLALILELAKPAADYSKCQRRFKWLMLGGMAALLAGVL